MRVSLWPGLIAACRENMRRQQGRVRLFEIGSKFDVDGQPRLREIDTLARRRDRRALAGAMGQCARAAGFLRRESRCRESAGA